MMTNLKPPKIEVSAQKMKEIADRELQLVRKDAASGISQAPDGRKFRSYRSAQYVKYKSNYMRRFTNRTGAKGTLLKGHTSVVSNEIGFVNETLTGRMYNDMYISSAQVNSVMVNFHPKDGRKIIGAADLGREIVGLNDKNIDIVEEMIFNILSKQIDDYAREDVVITVSK